MFVVMHVHRRSGPLNYCVPRCPEQHKPITRRLLLRLELWAAERSRCEQVGVNATMYLRQLQAAVYR
jgi:hypothetical protein